MDLNSNVSDLHKVPSGALRTSDFSNMLKNHHRYTPESLDTDNAVKPTYDNKHLHRRCASALDINQQLEVCTTIPSNKKNIYLRNSPINTTNDIHDKHMLESPPFRQTHTRHLSDISLNNNYTLWDDSFHDKNISLDDISRSKTIQSLTLDNINELEDNIDTIDRSINMDIDPNTSIALSDNALLCLKTLVSPISIFFHIGRFALTSISTTFSFATTFVISDLLFFSFLDKFDLSYLRYVLLGVTGIVAAFSIKGIASSIINLILSIVKGTYSWYFSLIDPQCSFTDFLFGINEVTMNKS